MRKKKEIEIHSLSAKKSPSIQFPIGAKGLYFTAVCFGFSLYRPLVSQRHSSRETGQPGDGSLTGLPQ